MECHILTTEQDIERIASDWRDLFARVGSNPLSNYGFYNVWWQTVARQRGYRPCLATGRQGGKLVALIPFVIRAKGPLRVLFMAGHDVSLGPMQLGEEASLRALWQEVGRCRLYDVAEIRHVRQEMWAVFDRFPLAKIVEDNLAWQVRFEGQNGEEWYKKTFSSKRRTEFQRRNKLLAQKGAISFDVYRDKIPDEKVRTLIDQKRAWCRTNNLDSYVIRDDAFMKGLTEEGAQQGNQFLFCLRCGEKDIGFCLGFSRRDVFLDYLTTYDPDFAFFSPGVAVHLSACKWAADNGFKIFDLMEGREFFKKALANTNQPTRKYIFCRTPVGLIGWAWLLLRNRKYALENKKQTGGP